MSQVPRMKYCINKYKQNKSDKLQNLFCGVWIRNLKFSERIYAYFIVPTFFL